MTDPQTLRLVFWNTFLLHPHPISGGPGLPPVADLAAPSVAERAIAIGAALSRRFDVAALSEVFEEADKKRILTAWGTPTVNTAAGPGRSLIRGPLGFSSSGLFTLVDGPRIVRRSTHRFRARGSYLYDADSLSNKGVLLTEIGLGDDVSGGNLELYSTHLLWGSGLLGGTTAVDPRRRHRLRMAQLDELVAFVERSHRPGNVIAVVGDMNVPAEDPAYPEGADRQYRDLTERLGGIGLTDLWTTHGTGLGHTCGAPTDSFADQTDPDDPDALVDLEPDEAQTAARDQIDPALVAERERIDYLFLADPDPSQRVRVEATSVRRYAFPRFAHASSRHRLVRLSDHLAIGADLAISPV